MPALSLTDIVNYVSKVGSPKLTHVRDIKNRGDYGPEKDFYRRLRLGIVSHHKKPGAPKSDLDDILIGLHVKKIGPYTTCVKSHKRFIGAKSMFFFSPPSDTWTRGTLDVRVNPELGLMIGGNRNIVKLYLNKKPLDKARADMILVLMKDALVEAEDNDIFVVLDVARGKAFSTSTPNMGLLPLVEAEAASFSVLWASL